MAATQRRSLDFSNYEEVLADIGRLQTAGYQQLGQWTLGPMCDHLASALNSTIDGFGYSAAWPVRIVARRFLPGILRKRRMPSGAKIPGRFAPSTDISDETGARRLAPAIDRWLHHTGPPSPHPYFGQLTREQWNQLQLIHCGHHLSFLVPCGGHNGK